jgi:RNA polymerase sigma-70 factor (ECF subfamily)
VSVPHELDDSVIVDRCLAGDTDAFELLVDRYHRVLFSVALRMLGDRDEAADATQTAFVKAYERLTGYRAEYRFFSWIYRILANECLNRLRARRPQEPLDTEVPGPGGPVDAFEAAERRRQVQAAILALTPEYREVIVLRHFADLSYDEIAQTLGIGAGTVKSRLYSARQQLCDRLGAWASSR